jgi:hypothetical protein
MFVPPALKGALHVTVAEVFAAVAPTLRGAPGAAATGVAEASLEKVEDPVPFTASTVK